jgi:hypothetical protein
MTRLANKGATTKQMMGASGHKSLAMVELYSAAAEHTLPADAAFEKLEGKAAG